MTAGTRAELNLDESAVDSRDEDTRRIAAIMAESARTPLTPGFNNAMLRVRGKRPGGWR